MTSVQGVSLEVCFPSRAGVVVFLSGGKAQAYVGAGALPKGSGHVWVVSCRQESLDAAEEPAPERAPLKLGGLALLWFLWSSTAGQPLCCDCLEGCFSFFSSYF